MKIYILGLFALTIIAFGCKKDYIVLNPTMLSYKLFDSVEGNGPYVHFTINRLMRFTHFPSTQSYIYQGVQLTKTASINNAEYYYSLPATDLVPRRTINFTNDSIKIRYTYSSHTTMDVYGYRVQ